MKFIFPKISDVTNNTLLLLLSFLTIYLEL